MSLLIEPLTESVTSENTIAGRKRVLVCAPHYLPGYKCGGPIRSIANMVKGLGSHFDFFVVTRDRDATDTESYPGPDAEPVVSSRECASPVLFFHRPGGSSPRVSRGATGCDQPELVSR